MVPPKFHSLDLDNPKINATTTRSHLTFAAQYLPAGQDACLEIHRGGEAIGLLGGAACAPGHQLSEIARNYACVLEHSCAPGSTAETILVCGKYFFEERTGGWTFAPFIERRFRGGLLMTSRPFDRYDVAWGYDSGSCAATLSLFRLSNVFRPLHVVAKLKVDAMREYPLDDEDKSIEGLIWFCRQGDQVSFCLVSRESTWARDMTQIGSLQDYLAL